MDYYFLTIVTHQVTPERRLNFDGSGDSGDFFRPPTLADMHCRGGGPASTGTTSAAGESDYLGGSVSSGESGFGDGGGSGGDGDGMLVGVQGGRGVKVVEGGGGGG